MNAQETWDRFLRGKKTWNEWAEQKLALRGANQGNEQWQEETKVDFSGKTFASESIDFDGWIFPGKTIFDHATFEGEVSFVGRFEGEVSFEETVFKKRTVFGAQGQAGATFRHSLNFKQIRFEGDSCFYALPDKTVFENVDFGGKADFRGVLFHQGITFYAHFRGDALFDFAKFFGDVFFRNNESGCHFYKEASFESVTFNGNMDFSGVSFGTSTSFKRVSFPEGRKVDFTNASFAGKVDFESVVFHDNVLFRGTKFGQGANGETNFALASFKGLADFTEATFGNETSFRGMHADRIFSLKKAEFSGRVPNFEQAHFTEAPLFDETKFVAPKYNDKGEERKTSKEKAEQYAKEDASRWRALKRLAIQGHDHDLEMDFFAEEILALRTANRGFWGLARAFVVMVFRLLLFPFSFFIKIVFPGLFRKKSIGSRGAGADWVGCFYELFADFGRSAIRPVLWWLLSFMIFWGVFSWFIPPQPFENRTTAEIEDCRRYQQPPSEADRWQESFWLSLHNALVVGVDKEDDMKSTYCHLYGKPVPRQRVQVISVFQKIFSALMIFLFGLAIRNRLRIK